MLCRLIDFDFVHIRTTFLSFLFPSIIMLSSIFQGTQRLYLWKLSSTKNICYRKYLFNETSEIKDLQFFATDLTEKIPDPRNAKEHYRPFLRKKYSEMTKDNYWTTKMLWT